MLLFIYLFNLFIYCIVEEHFFKFVSSNSYLLCFVVKCKNQFSECNLMFPRNQGKEWEMVIKGAQPVTRQYG